MAREPGTYAVIETTVGNIVCRLFETEAPKTVQNFIELAEGKRDWKDNVSGKKGPGPLYNGTVFHRVIPDFMIQGGDPSGTGMGGPGYTFEDEFNDQPAARGALAMANAGPNTNGSQFFIVTADACPWLDGKHTVFGQVTDGMDVVDAISALPTDGRDRPHDDVTIERVVHGLGLLDVRWNVDSLDSRVGATPGPVAREIVRNLKPGAIVLMHDTHPWAAKVVPMVLAAARKNHLWPVPVPRLLEVDPPDPSYNCYS